MKGLVALLMIPPMLSAACGAIFIVFWLSKVRVGALDLDQTLLVAVACFASTLLYLVALGGVLIRRRCFGQRVGEEHEELRELEEEGEE